ncbi:MAG: AmmeMemoRadiSam system protein B [Nitratireductor sp.]
MNAVVLRLAGRIAARLLRGVPPLLAVLLAALLSPAACAAGEDCGGDGPPFASLYQRDDLFRRALADAENAPVSARRLSGVTVPHHLLAGHLIAEGIKAASGQRYTRVVVLFPDHFRQTDTMFATTRRDFDTVFGRLAVDGEAVAGLLARGGEVIDARSCLFGRDHGLQAILPFLSHFLPGVSVVPVAVSIASRRQDWERLAAALGPLADADTLIVQSTDFSHYLPHHAARAHDQQTLALLAAGTFDQIARLRQPEHVDSLGALYVQLKLQREVYGAATLVAANENSQQYDPLPTHETTSYMVVLFGPMPMDEPAPARRGTRHLYLGGDTSFGRAMIKALLDERASARLETEILQRTEGRPLVVNLEGVVLPNLPEGLGHMTLAMPQDLTLAWLKRLNVAAVSLANNHARDLGETGLAETRRALETAGIVALGQGELTAIEGVELVALTDLDVNGSYRNDLITPDMLDRLSGRSAERPLVALVHWGREYATDPGARERYLAEELSRRGVAGLFGGHSHAASPAMQALAGGDTLQLFSLGNFLFDQGADKASGALVELTVFDQGTIFARLMPLPNLFELARTQARAQQDGRSSSDR